MAKPLTVAGLERRLRALLLSPRVKLRHRRMLKHRGICHIRDGGQIVITIDPTVDQIATTAHELIHGSLDAKLSWWGEFSEGFVRNMEADLDRYINKSNARQEWWLASIVAKLGEGD